MKMLITLLLLQTCTFAFCQTTLTTKGKVKDNTGAAVPFAAIFIKHTNTGLYADSLGNFSIATKMGDTLSVSAIGYVDVELPIANKNELTVSLKKDTKNLSNVNVKGNRQLPSSQQISNTDQQVIFNTFNDYIMSQKISFSTINNYTYAPSNARSSADIVTFMSVVPASGGLYNGSLLPVYTHVDATVGSRYLFESWVQGVVVNSNDALINNGSYMYNYDKMGQALLLTQDKKNVIEVDKEKVKVFSLKGNDKEYVFETVMVNNKPQFLQVLAQANGKLKLYKAIKTKFEKANYVSAGLTESGHNYDLFIDVPTYYVFSTSTKQLTPIELKKKSIKAAFPQDQAKVDTYFSQHADMTIDENFVIGLANSLIDRRLIK